MLGHSVLGIELDDATGKNDGEVKGVRLFSCEPNHGAVMRPSAVEIIDSTLRKVAAHVNDEMKLMTIKHLRENGLPHYMLAPVEADGQLAKLLKDGLFDYISTVDSDLLALSDGKVLFRLSPAGWVDSYYGSKI